MHSIGIAHQQMASDRLNAKALWAIELNKSTVMPAHFLLKLQIRSREELQLTQIIRDDDLLGLSVECNAPWSVELLCS